MGKPSREQALKISQRSYHYLKEVIQTEANSRKKGNNHNHPEVGQDEHQAISLDMPEGTKNDTNDWDRIRKWNRQRQSQQKRAENDHEKVNQSEKKEVANKNQSLLNDLGGIGPDLLRNLRRLGNNLCGDLYLFKALW